MKIFFDTEFTGLHKNTSLISLGLVDEDGRAFYAEFKDYDKSQINDWLSDNVIKHLKYKGTDSISSAGWVKKENCMTVYGNKEFVAKHLKVWLSKYKKVQLVSDVCHYDMVLFIDLFGTAFDLPSNVSPSCHDINQDIADYMDITEKEAFDINREKFLGCYISDIKGKKHNALYDAKVIKGIYNKIKNNLPYGND